MNFICKHQQKSWPAYIASLKNHGTHYEFVIQSRSRIMVVFGKTSQGHFACMPDFDAGCHLADLNDIFWNTEKLTAALGMVDGVTVATALGFLYKDLNYPDF